MRSLTCVEPDDLVTGGGAVAFAVTADCVDANDGLDAAACGCLRASQ